VLPANKSCPEASIHTVTTTDMLQSSQSLLTAVMLASVQLQRLTWQRTLPHPTHLIS